MPNIKSAKKRVLTSKKKCEQNILVDSRMKNSIKKLEKTVKDGNKEERVKVLNTTLKNIDKAQSAGLIHKNNAARKKSRLAKKLNKLIAGWLTVINPGFYIGVMKKWKLQKMM